MFLSFCLNHCVVLSCCCAVVLCCCCCAVVFLCCCCAFVLLCFCCVVLLLCCCCAVVVLLCCAVVLIMWLFLFSDCVLFSNRFPLHHPRLLHSMHCEQAEEEDSWGEEQAEESCVCGCVCCYSLLLLLPTLRHRQSHPADRATKRMGKRRKHSGSGL